MQSAALGHFDGVGDFFITPSSSRDQRNGFSALIRFMRRYKTVAALLLTELLTTHGTAGGSFASGSRNNFLCTNSVRLDS
eukprot:scaffold97558_cov23-Cyclotella_meneghiniana.AAC.2